MIYFKTKKQHDDCGKMDARLIGILFMISGMAEFEKGHNIIVTDTLRTKEEDDKLGSVGIHPTGRALDFEFCDKNIQTVFDDNYRDALLSMINRVVPFGSGKYPTLLFHDVGFGKHFHLQVNPLGETKLVK